MQERLNIPSTSAAASAKGPFIGTAAWTVPKDFSEHFPGEGTHLERYARVLSGVEINSSFYREHKPGTYRKWADSVPAQFKFSVKLSKQFTHVQKLKINSEGLKAVLGGIQELGDKWDCLLIQLPPSLALDEITARVFFAQIRSEFSGLVAFEPRHVSWATATALAVYREFNITKVVADPEPCPLPSGVSLGKSDRAYFRLHGSPEIYKSNYSQEFLTGIYSQIRATKSSGEQAWCIFDNTTFGFATGNALQMESFKKDHSVIPSLDA